MGVHVKFTSQSTTSAISIENGSLFEEDSKFEKLKIYLITLVSIRSDWEYLPWLFRSVEYLVKYDGRAKCSRSSTNKNRLADCTLLSMFTNQEKKSSFRCSKDTEEPHLSDIYGHLA
ncbi:hypothetical protein Tco_0441007 [Tanacetum coccineum]